jgi:hypothetical protein
MISRAITVVAFASFSCVRALAAQAGPDMVPIEFVRMLTITPFMSTPEVAVGRLPERLANDLAPGPDTRIIGSLTTRRFSVGALVMRGRSPEVQERLAAQLVEKGWRKLPATTPDAPRGGFETPFREPRNGPLTLCSTDDHNVQINVSNHRGDSAAVRLFLGRDNFGVSCVDPGLTSSSAPANEAPIPALRAPAGTEYRGGGSGSGSGSRWGDAHGQLRSDMEPAALLEHYAAQMIAAGWQAGARTSSAEVALQVFRKTDDPRPNWQGVLYVVARPNRERDLYLHVTREQ